MGETALRIQFDFLRIGNGGDDLGFVMLAHAFEILNRALTQADQPISRRTVSRDHAVQYFKGMGEHYKAEIVASIPDTEEIKLYSQGSFTDLCRGPHVPSTG